MLTSVQKEILQSLINLYRNADASIKGEEIAEIMNRNPGTIRNQMQSLRSLGLVKGVPGPRGGYKPTIKAYHTLNIQASDNQTLVPIYRGDEKVKDITVSQIEFTSITHPGECEAAIKAVGNNPPRNNAIKKFSFFLGERTVAAVSRAESRIS